MSKFDSILENFKKAVLRLEEVLKEKKTDITRDSAIKRFEICFDLCWKTIKTFLEEENNIICCFAEKMFSRGVQTRVD